MNNAYAKVDPLEKELPVLLINGWAQPKTAVVSFMDGLQRLGPVDVLELDRSEPELRGKIGRWLNRCRTGGHLLGWSLGGQVLLRALQADFIRDYLPRIESISLVACNPRFIENEDWPGVAATRFQEFQELLTTDKPALLQKFLKLQLLGGPAFKRNLQDLRASLHESGSWSTDQLADSLAWLGEWDARSALSQLTLPVRCFLGTEDRLVPPGLAPLLSKLGEHVGVELIQGMSHYPDRSAGHSIADRLVAGVPL